MTCLSLDIISQCCGYSQLLIWFVGMYCFLREPIVRFTSSGLSKDMILLQAFGFTFMAIQDQFGVWSPLASYRGEVHYSDIITSFMGSCWAASAMVILFTVPNEVGKEANNRISPAGISICLLAVVVGIVGYFLEGLNFMCIVFGMTKSILSTMSYLPQFWLIYK
jgi:hypothetical protein